jgi:hypothetical protein
MNDNKVSRMIHPCASNSGALDPEGQCTTAAEQGRCIEVCCMTLEGSEHRTSYKRVSATRNISCPSNWRLRHTPPLRNITQAYFEGALLFQAIGMSRPGGFVASLLSQRGSRLSGLLVLMAERLGAHQRERGLL